MRAEVAVEEAAAPVAVAASPAPAPVAPLPRSFATPSRPGQSNGITRPTAQAATLALPLKAILDRLPADLSERVRQLEVGGAEVAISMQKILSQIAQGAVRMSFGELRQLSPAGTFSAEADKDRTLIEVPLQEILSRLSPALLSRRPVQRKVFVPAEVTGPFGAQSQFTISAAPLKPMPASARTTTPAEPEQPAKVEPAQTVQAVQSLPESPRVAAPVAKPAASPLARPTTPVIARIRVTPPTSPTAEENLLKKIAPQPAAPAQPVHSPIAPTPIASTSIAMPEGSRLVAPISPIAPIAPLAAPITPIAPAPIQEREPIRFQMPVAAPAVPVASAAAPVAAQPPVEAETRFLTLAIAELSQNWPDSVQQEIANNQLTKSAVHLPFGVMEVAMKLGKISIPWRIVRSWIRPAVVVNGSIHDAVILDLPLKLVTPLFLAELRAPKSQKKISLDENIPDLFSNKLQPEAPAASPVNGKTIAAPIAPAAPIALSVAPAAPPAPAATVTPTPKPSDTNYFSKTAVAAENQPEEPAPAFKKGTTPGTAFLVRYATPNEIVAKAAALAGVDGALIALPDGLLVASEIPSTMNADTVAAFLPQIFGRVTQCTKELRLGDLNNLNFTVGAVPWKIFKVGAIYFAAFGRAGEPLPGAQLAGIAAELDRKGK